jgi:uncharacterized protein involved in type VI secretion and phage assembly
VSGKTYGAMPIIQLSGNPLPEGIQMLVKSVEVETDTGGPDSCRIVFDDMSRTKVAGLGLDFHLELRVTAGRVGEKTGEPLFSGRVYDVGFEYDGRGGFTTVLAFDKSYDLYNGRHTATYQHMTDSDLARKLAKEVGLRPGRIEPTTVVHEHLSQINETHWDFLARRAREIGFTLRATGDTLDFAPSADAAQAPAPGDYDSVDRLALVPGGNLEQLSARVTAATQVTEVEVRGWDPVTKRAISGIATARSRGAKLPDKPDEVAAKAGSPRHVTFDTPLTTQAECDAAAQALAERMASTFVHAEGTAAGDPRIVSGAAVSLGQTGGRFDGKVTVSRARHVWDRKGYHTSFTVSGAHDRSVLGLVSGEDRRNATQRINGVVVGIVTNCSDPQSRGRVKLRFPWLSDDYESDWARVAQIGAGGKRGLLLLPEVNDEVLVAFEQGDSRRPYVIGGLFNGVDAVPFPNAVDRGSGKVQVRGLRTRVGHELIFTDTDGEERIELRTKSRRVSVVLDARDGGIRIEAEGDVSIRATGNAKLTAAKDLTIETAGTGVIKAKRGLTLESKGDVAISGKTIKMN